MRLFAAPLAASIVLMMLMNAPSASAQGGGVMTVESDLSITGLSTLDGSGTVKITLTGDAANITRVSALGIFDNLGDQNQIFGTDEIRMFIQAVADATVGKPYWGMTIKSVTNFSDESDKYVVDHTSGLKDSRPNTTGPMSLSFGFEGSGSGAKKDIMLAQGAYDAFGLAIGAACGYLHVGEFVVKTSVSMYGLCSLTSPHLEDGKISAIRLPWGEMMWFEFRGEIGTDVLNERISYETFSVMESQLVSFVVLFIGVYMILRTPGKRFDKYEKLHPRKFRKYAKPLFDVTASAWALIALLVILYLLPYLFSFSSPGALFYAAYLYAVVPAAVIVELMYSKFRYDSAALDIPEESVIEVKQAVVEPAEGEGEILCKVCYMPIDAGLDIFQCGCGLTMHVDCAQKAQNCPACGQPLIQLKTRSIQCRACGETFLHSGDEDAYSIQCTKCGAFQEDIKAGKNYLIVDAEPRNAFMMIRAMGLSNRPAMCLTTSFPGKIRADYDLKDVAIKWFSDSTTDIDNINPKDLDVDAMETVSTFLMTTKGAGLLLDGILALTDQNGFDKVLAFIKNVNDLAKTHGSTILMSLDKTKLSADQFKAVSELFDEVHDYQ